MKHKPPDMILFFIVLLLVAIGIAMVLSASTSTSLTLTHGDPYYFIKRQCAWLVLGFIGMFLAYRADLRLLRQLSPWLLFGTYVLLALVLIPHIGVVAGGARRWLSVGPFGFEPSELAKVVLVLFTAWFFTRRDSVSTSLVRTILPLLVLVLPLAALVFKQPDFGTSVVMIFVLAVMLVISGMPMSQLVIMGSLALPAGFFLMSRAHYRKERWSAFFHPWKDPLGSGYHIIQGLIALGSGGITGVGLGAGRQKYYYLPEQHTDYIFAVLGEEGGFIATIFVLFLFVVLAARGMSIALKVRDPYAKLLAGGLTSLLVGQAILNMGMVMSLLPPAGVSLPFVSYGGSSLLSAMVCAGLLLNLSKASGDRRTDIRLEEKMFVEQN